MTLVVLRPVPAFVGVLSLLVLAVALLSRGLSLLGVRCMAIFVRGSPDGGRLLRVWIHSQRSRLALLLHLFGNVKRHVNWVGLSGGLSLRTARVRSFGISPGIPRTPHL